MPFQKGRSGNIVTQFKRGRSGNPAGRPLDLTRYIRKTTGEGGELVNFMLAVFRGDVTEIPNSKAGAHHRNKIDLRDRIAAATWLADRAFGRPGQVLDDEVPDVPRNGHDLSALSLDELRAMQGLLDKAARYEVIDTEAVAVLPAYSRTSPPGSAGPLASVSPRRSTALTPP